LSPGQPQVRRPMPNPGGGHPRSPSAPPPGHVQTPGAGLPQSQRSFGSMPGVAWTPGAGMPQSPHPTPGAGLPGSQPPHRSGPPPGSSHDSAGPGRSRRNPVLIAGAALAAALVLLAAVWFFAFRDKNPGRNEPDNTGAAAAKQAAADARRYGTPTVTEDCPAAEASDGRARCTKRAQCWSGIVLIQGQLTGIRELPCEEGHVYETFAIADLPPGIVDAYQDTLAAEPSVKQVCGPNVMLASRYGEATKYGAERWSIEVLPPTPDDREAGRDIYRCVATLTGVEGLTGSVFRPR